MNKEEFNNKKKKIIINKNIIFVDNQEYKTKLSKIKAKTSNIYINSEYIFKQITRICNFDLFKREIHILELINKKFNWAPKLICYDTKNKIIMMTYCGKRINKENCQNDWEDQINTILQEMNSLNLKHNDIKPDQEILVKNQKIFICDWGWGSINNDFSCGIGLWNKKKPHGITDDKCIIDKINAIKAIVNYRI